MNIFRLSEKLEFPSPYLSKPNGLLCIGGDLSTRRLLLAYKKGIFPWFSKNNPILWWSPDPRLVIFPEDINISKSLNKKIRKKLFKITINNAFERTIISCAKPRKKEKKTWLVDRMIKSYIKLHREGYAHSVETWNRGKLVGGLYGVCIGGSFFGESMFSFMSDASKIALVALAAHLERNDFDLIDCQIRTDHLLRMGAVEISRDSFLKKISMSVKRKDIKNIWDTEIVL